MIQDIGDRHFYNEWEQTTPNPEDQIFVFQGRDILLSEEETLPTYAQLKELNIPEYRYLFRVDGERYFLAWSDQPISLRGFHYQFARSFRNIRPMYRSLAGYTAIHLNNWYRANRFCGRCGKPMVHGTDERKMVCPSCGNLVYPRLNPSVIVAVTDHDRLLMIKYNQRTHAVHHYVLVAGFVEIGETLEQCVAREVMEEAGVKVKNIRYFSSQPWGCDGNIIMGFTAELDGNDRISADLVELDDCRWFERSEVPVPDDDVSVTSELIHQFAAGKF